MSVPQKQKTMELFRLRDDPFLVAKTLKFTLNFLREENDRIENCAFFKFITEVIGHRPAIKLARNCGNLRYLDALTKKQLAADRAISPLNLLMERWNEPRTRQPFTKALLAALEKKLAEAEKRAAAATAHSVFHQRFQNMIRVFSLGDHEADLFLLAYIRHADIWEWLEISRGRPAAGRFECVRLMCQALGVPLSVGGKFLYKSSRLLTLGCLDADFDFNSELEPFLVGFTDEPLASRYFARHTEPALPWAMHGKLAAQHGELLKELIRRCDAARGLNILLYGEPGAGKTSFAVSLAAELGLDLFRIRVPEECDSKETDRFAAVRICDSQVNHDRSMILIDEADDMLGGGNGLARMLLGRERTNTGGKDTLNTILDQLQTPCIWITNTGPEALDPSSRRRFDYSIRFNPLSHQQRCEVWKNLVDRYQLQAAIDESTIARFARRFGVSAGGVDIVLRNFSRLLSQSPSPSRPAADILEQLLIPHCELLGIDPDGNAARITGDYALTGLNVRSQTPPQRVLDAVRQFRQFWEARRQSSARDESEVPPLNVLLSGPPGTGKTEFVKFMGRELDYPVRTCMACDFLDKYVGGTEQKIRRVFHAAEADHAILFIDEADGMLRSRRFAERSWEVTQVNELLHAMETFTGVLVCATNSVEMLDPATIRRFTFKLEFDFLDAAGKLLFYERMFAQICKQPLDDAGRRRLSAITDLAPGDFHTVRQAMYYLGDGEKAFTHDDLLAALEQEGKAKRQGRSGNFGFGRR